jgi:D-glycero-alpha-D-manno-heptose-7-phosphate kinase
VTVATLGALDLLTPGRRTPHEIAALAHYVETELLGLQCGIQDQLCSAYGGVCFIEMHDYPRASVSQVYLPNSVWWELERRIVLVYLGNAHASSQVHGQVIGRLEAHEADRSALEPLREAASHGKDALFCGDFEGFGRAMDLNTKAQAALHPALVSEQARRIMDLGRSFGAVGGKVNGAGGDGGSVTLLFGPEGIKKRDFIRQLRISEPQAQVIPTYLSRMGLRTWEAAR